MLFGIFITKAHTRARGLDKLRLDRLYFRLDDLESWCPVIFLLSFCISSQSIVEASQLISALLL